MGGAVSTGVDNDHLIDNLIEANFIKTPSIEKVFRSVDRAFYFLPEFRKAAYKDLAWKHNNLHLSAPCIYSKVLEELNLKPGQSFLNIGSGTGYLSTMIGLILGPYGINHGIEIHKDVVDYAYKKLEQFKKQCSAVDVFEFCEPDFIVGNGFHLQTDRKYDRIYCGAACPLVFHDNIKEYLKIGGVLIVPCEDDLLKFVRKSQNTWEVKPVLQVSFSTLHPPDKKISLKTVEFEETSPPSLQSLCRSKIRAIIRDVCENDDTDLTRPRDKPVKENRRKKYNAERHLVIPIFENLSGSDPVSAVSNRANGRLNFGRLIFHNYSAAGFQTFIRNLTRDDDIREYNDVVDDENRSNASATGDRITSDVEGRSREMLRYDDRGADEGDDSTRLSDAETCPGATRCEKRAAAAAYAPFGRTLKNVTEFCSDSCSRISSPRRRADDTVVVAGSSRGPLPSFCGECSSAGCAAAGDNEDASASKKSSHEAEPTTESPLSKCSTSSSTRTAATKSVARDDEEEEEEEEEDNDVDEEVEEEEEEEEEEEDDDDDYCGSQPKKIPKREKLDSGISEESDDGKMGASNESSSYSESTFSEAMDVESDDSDFSDYSSSETRFSSDLDCGDLKFDSDESKTPVKYRMALEKRIQALPLPIPIKIFLNYDREFKFPC